MYALINIVYKKCSVRWSSNHTNTDQAGTENQQSTNKEKNEQRNVMKRKEQNRGGNHRRPQSIGLIETVECSLGVLVVCQTITNHQPRKPPPKKPIITMRMMIGIKKTVAQASRQAHGRTVKQRDRSSLPHDEDYSEPIAVPINHSAAGSSS